MALADTRWSLVLRAGAGSLGALEGLCGTYWFPVYAYLRRRGYDPEDASELTQEFFVGLLRRNDLAKVTREGGRFRSWLFTALQRHAFRERKKAEAGKRRHASVDDAEARFERTVAPGLDPEAVFARQWALGVLESARLRVRARYVESGQESLFDALSPVLTDASRPYGELARQLGMREGAVKVAVHRLKKRYGEALRHEVADTLDGPREIEVELRSLLDALAGR
ncbi:MAG: sigma-70 family RNA polymerase sigma factor [Myxococcales bacterium]|nr:sigma-70 family RNA polymerase sigma factor [Myxococcales bacterium]MCB9671804.1 sigma-70 family RNA polymerase sigma factor [Alphaproteobacteria bacterium]